MLSSCLDRVMSVYLFCLARVVCGLVFNQLLKFEEKCLIITDFQPYLESFSVEVLSTYSAQIYIRKSAVNAP